jgi:hypothetical protein
MVRLNISQASRALFCKTHPKLVNSTNAEKLSPAIDVKMLDRIRNCITKEMTIYRIKDIVEEGETRHTESYCKLKKILDTIPVDVLIKHTEQTPDTDASASQDHEVKTKVVLLVLSTVITSVTLSITLVSQNPNWLEFFLFGLVIPGSVSITSIYKLNETLNNIKREKLEYIQNRDIKTQNAFVNISRLRELIHEHNVNTMNMSKQDNCNCQYYSSDTCKTTIKE